MTVAEFAEEGIKKHDFEKDLLVLSSIEKVRKIVPVVLLSTNIWHSQEQMILRLEQTK